MKVQKVLRGPGKLKNVPDLLSKLGIHRPMLIGGKTLVSRLLRACPALLSAPVFGSYHPNPDLADAVEGADLFRRSGCDGLLSIGGGSAMDTAKALLVYLSGADPLQPIPAELPCPHLAIPGTAGSGAEATPTAVVYVDGKKYSLSSPALLPDVVVLDPELLASLPPYHQKSCALDALAQGIESYWAAAATDDSRVHAFLAIVGVLDNLKSYLAGDPHAAAEMLDASYQSGKAIALTRTTAAHAMSYQITKKLGPAHGHACFLTLPALWEDMAQHENLLPLLSELASRMRLSDQLLAPKLLRGILYDLELEIPPMPDEETLASLADSVNLQRLSNHPVPLSREDLLKIYRISFAKPNPLEKQLCLDLWRYYGGNP